MTKTLTSDTQGVKCSVSQLIPAHSNITLHYDPDKTNYRVQKDLS